MPSLWTLSFGPLARLTEDWPTGVKACYPTQFQHMEMQISMIGLLVISGFWAKVPLYLLGLLYCFLGVAIIADVTWMHSNVNLPSYDRG